MKTNVSKNNNILWIVVILAIAFIWIWNFRKEASRIGRINFYDQAKQIEYIKTIKNQYKGYVGNANYSHSFYTKDFKSIVSDYSFINTQIPQNANHRVSRNQINGAQILNQNYKRNISRTNITLDNFYHAISNTNSIIANKNNASTNNTEFANLYNVTISNKSTEKKYGFLAISSEIIVAESELFASTNYFQAPTNLDPGDFDPVGPPIPLSNNIQILIVMAATYTFIKYLQNRKMTNQKK